MITGPKISKALNALVSQIHGLSEFMAYDLPKDVLYSVARHHGSSIRHLRFRHTDHKGLHSHRILQRNTGELPPQAREGSFYGGCLFSPDELEDLSRQVPGLERLGIDMCFAGAMFTSASQSIILTASDGFQASDIWNSILHSRNKCQPTISRKALTDHGSTLPLLERYSAMSRNKSYFGEQQAHI
ncbi:hypothetical protein ASPCAL06751 [Aspergillus calidoustus]|uniref:Uncharacterized protein n=1 Tax=Aspergillus calidoustus TaxID=454130 RepID=A0A0U5G183_ASPCI|nr:hypothetical protein ASPCAL06751 [Aspergillus calidoustus]